MKYILIPISEIDSRIEELDKELYKDIKYNEIKKLQEKGEIVENIPHTYGEDYKLLKTIKQ